MHMLGEPGDMQNDPQYRDLLGEVSAFLANRMMVCAAAGIEPERIILDPGFGFGKTLEHNRALLRELPKLRVEDRPLLVGVSRKSMLGKWVGSTDIEDRNWPTVALTAWMRERGAEIVRVHDVKPNVEAMRMAEAIGLLTID